MNKTPTLASSTRTTPSIKSTTTKTVKKAAAVKRVKEVSEPVSKVEVECKPEVVNNVTVVQDNATEVVESTPSFRQRLENLIQANQSHMLVIKSQVVELKKLQREHEQLLKDASRKTKPKKHVRDFTKPRRSTGFAEPVVVSDELYAFLLKTKATMKDTTFTPSSQEEYDNWPRIPVKTGIPVARTDVTSHLSKYIKEHNLQNPNERREIVPDAALKKLFSEPVENSKSDPSKKVYTYLKLQTYVNHHFPARKVETTV
jgi:chromatin remodeling complex protein RSC6